MPNKFAKSVHRQTCPITDQVDLTAPGFLRVLHVAASRVRPSTELEVWYECAPDLSEEIAFRIHIEGTGHRYHHRGAHVGTFSTDDGMLIWHVFAEYPIERGDDDA